MLRRRGDFSFTVEVFAPLKKRPTRKNTMDAEWIMQAIEQSGADLLFGAIVLTLFGATLLLLMFFLLAVRAAWRWLTRGSWNDVIRTAERRVLR